MSFLAGLTGCCVGLLTKLYSNSLRKLPYMRGKVFSSYFVSNAEYRAMGTCNLYVCGRFLVLLWKEVHCIDIIFKVMDYRITRRILFERCWSIWIEKMYMDLRNWRKNNLSFCYLLWWTKRYFLMICVVESIRIKLSWMESTTYSQLLTRGFQPVTYDGTIL